MSFEILDDSSYYSRRNDLGLVPVIPIAVYLMAGSALSAGAAVAAWLGKDEWSVGEYNYYMTQMYDTIKAWDSLGWKKGCWQKHPARREMWNSFQNQFGAHYGRGRIADYSYVSDSYERPARELMRRLSDWGTWLNQTCAASVDEIGPTPTALPTRSEAASDFGATVRWGVIGVLGVIGFKIYSDTRRDRTMR